jgi:hypothetical protein
MPTWVCPGTKAPCNKLEEDEELPTYTDEQKKKVAGWCPSCKTKLVEVKPKPGAVKVVTEEETLMKIVSEAREGAQKANKAHYAEYVKPLLDDLVGYPKVFKDDFLREWKTGEVQSKLYEPSNRLSGKSLDCVQQAVSAASLSWPDRIPTGEKFQFELPYVLGKGLKWAYVGDLKNAYSFLLKTLKTQKNKFYLVSVQSAPTGAMEGHMILIVTDGENSASLLDFQNQKSQSRALGCLEHYYAAWSFPRPETYTVPSWAMEIKLG